MDVLESTSTSQEYLQLCPAQAAPHSKDSQRHQITFSGTPSLAYTAEIAYTNQSVSLGDKIDFTVTNAGQLFSFKAPKNITSSQLDITVTSDSNIPAYLKVSRNCPDVVNSRISTLNIDEQSLRLSFSEKGRITLSHASSPKLKGQEVWYIGLALKNSSGAGPFKNVTLSLKMGFNYDYLEPICFLIFVSLFGGIFVAVWALFCFREPLKLVQEDNQFSESMLSIKVTIKNILRTWCIGKDKDELRPLLRQNIRDNSSLPVLEVIKAMWKVLQHYWFGYGPKTFSYTTCIVGFVLLIGAVQFVYENWHNMIETGDRDKCYYNDFCYRVSDSDIPFNLMISNLAYMIHGLILACSVWVMEAELWVWSKRLAEESRFRVQQVPEGHEEIPQHLLKCHNIPAHMQSMTVPVLEPSTEEANAIFASAHKRRISYSIGYAFAWALIFEGVFSLLYHFCPTKLTFQFDSAFMFIIAGLIVLSLFNGFSVRESCTTDTAKPVDAANFFLFVLVPLYIFNYLGSLYSLPKDMYNLNHILKVLFVVSLCIWYLLIFLWAGCKLFYPVKSCEDLSNCEEMTKAILFVLTIGVTCILLPILFKNDLPHLFLFSCIAASLISIFGKVLLMFWKSDRSDCTFKKVIFRILQGSYILITLGVMAVAVWVFTDLPTSDKTKTPEKSRNLNQECLLLGFYDYHDLWHIMSSFALLMGTYLVMYVSE